MRPYGKPNHHNGNHPHGGRGHRGHRGHGHHQRGGQGAFARSELRLLFLSLMTSEPCHGYELIRAIKARSAGAYAPSPGIVYPTLAELNDSKLIAEAEGESGRKVFAITADGQAEVAGKADELEQLNMRLAALATQEAEQNAPIRRALANLEMVLVNANAEQTHDVVALIDDAAQKIERLGSATAKTGE